jgi:hypothetical protein
MHGELIIGSGEQMISSKILGGELDEL